MASIRRPHSPAKSQHLLRHQHPFAASSPPSSPLRHSSSASSSSPRHHHTNLPHPFLFFTRRPLPRFAAFFLLGSFLGLLHFLSHLPLHPHLPVPPNASSQLNQQQQEQQPAPHLDISGGGGADEQGDKLLIIITPTRARASQEYYLTRLGQTLRLVRPPVLWVVVEAGKPTPEAALALRHTAVMHRYVGCCDKLNASASVGYRSHQMNAGLEVVENHRLDGVVYFADEEDVYSLQLFDRLRQIRRTSARIRGKAPALCKSVLDMAVELKAAKMGCDGAPQVVPPPLQSVMIKSMATACQLSDDAVRELDAVALVPVREDA